MKSQRQTNNQSDRESGSDDRESGSDDRESGSDDRESGSDSRSDSSNDSSSSDDDDDDDGENLLMRPVYVKKSQRQLRITKPSIVAKFDGGKVGSIIEDNEPVEDDIDDVDPELEYNQWKQRELFRYNRDLLMMKSVEDDKRKNPNENEQDEVATVTRKDCKSVFFNHSFDHLKRDFSTIEPQDHSRPLKRSQLYKKK
jgi:microfibrillar-associated protein 1